MIVNIVRYVKIFGLRSQGCVEAGTVDRGLGGVTEYVDFEIMGWA